jgi:DNA-binding MltR family transcriptional regulator
MKLFDTLDDSNILLYAAKHYYKPNVIDAEEFYDDLKRFMYLKRLLNRYYNTGELADRLILNHLIVIFNVFDIKPSLKMLEFHMNYKYWQALKPFLIFLKTIKNDEYTDIEMDKKVIERLRDI